MGKNIGKNISENLSGKYNQKFQKSFQPRVSNVSKSSAQDNSETITNEYDKEVPEDIYKIWISRRKIENYWWSKNNIIV